MSLDQDTGSHHTTQGDDLDTDSDNSSSKPATKPPPPQDGPPDDIRAFFGHPLTAATTAINGDDHSASAAALLHEYINLPALDKSGMKIGDKINSIYDILKNEELKQTTENAPVGEHDLINLLNGAEVDKFFSNPDMRDGVTEEVAETETQKEEAANLEPENKGESQPASDGFNPVVGDVRSASEDDVVSGENTTPCDTDMSVVYPPDLPLPITSTQMDTTESLAESCVFPSDMPVAIAECPEVVVAHMETVETLTTTPVNSTGKHTGTRGRKTEKTQEISRKLFKALTEKILKNRMSQQNSEVVKDDVPTVDDTPPSVAADINGYLQDSLELTAKLTDFSTKHEALLNEVHNQLPDDLVSSAASVTEALDISTTDSVSCMTVPVSVSAPSLHELSSTATVPAQTHIPPIPSVPPPRYPVNSSHVSMTTMSHDQVQEEISAHEEQGQVSSKGQCHISPPPVQGECQMQIPPHTQTPSHVTHDSHLLIPDANPQCYPLLQQVPVPPTTQTVPLDTEETKPNPYMVAMPPANYYCDANHGFVYPVAISQAQPQDQHLLHQVNQPQTPTQSQLPPNSTACTSNGVDRDLLMQRYIQQQHQYYQEQQAYTFGPAHNGATKESYNLKSPDSGFHEPCISPSDGNNQVYKECSNGSEKVSKRRKSAPAMYAKQFWPGMDKTLIPAIPKLEYDPVGYKYTLESPISTTQRIEEDRITYLNKGQYYGLTLELNGDRLPKMQTVKSVILVVFREDKQLEDERKLWEFWHARQHSFKQRVIDIDTKNSVNVVPSSIEEIAFNAVAVKWNPRDSPVKVNVAVHCLSTDFSSQKGVKGLPLHIQIDTFENHKDVYPTSRAYCQIKVFCDKGAERKTRDEERRRSSRIKQENSPSSRKRNEVVFHPLTERSEFYPMADLQTMPIFFNPKHEGEEMNENRMSPINMTSNDEDGSSSVTSSGGHFDNMDENFFHPAKRQRTDNYGLPQSCPRILLYVREQHETVFTALMLTMPNLQGLLKAVDEKYNVPVNKVTNAYKRSRKGILVRMDDNIVRHYSHESTFIIEINKTGENNADYEIILSEIDVS